MAYSPSQTWKDGVLTERAQDSRGATEKNTAVAVTGRANDTPIRDDEDAPLGGNSTFGTRGKAAAKASKTTTKAVTDDATENKAVGARKASKK